MLPEALKKHPLCASLNELQLQQLADNADYIDLSAQQHLFYQGDDAHKFFWLQQGQIKLYLLSANGQEKIIEIVQVGEVFAEALMFMQPSTYPVYAYALENSRVLSLDNATFTRFLHDSPQQCFAIMADLSRRLHALVEEINYLSLQNATDRVIHFLIQQLPDKSLDNYQVKLEINKQTLAAKLSIRPETLSRILKNLSIMGILDVQGRKITICSVQGLREQFTIIE
jgi:CRP/FNR family transcriptional regulator, dissimilatory nitrate respiration regulator